MPSCGRHSPDRRARRRRLMCEMPDLPPELDRRIPLLDQDELGKLAKDIAENGLREPTVTNAAGDIIDGRNRWLRCQVAGVEPVTRVYDGPDESVIPYVISA